jgi:hypothetical protein
VIILEATNTIDELVRQCLEQKWDTRQLIDKFMESEQPNGNRIVSSTV